LPFSNTGFNILAGDLSDSYARDDSLYGIIVIGNHELLDVFTLKNNINFDRFCGEFEQDFLHECHGGLLSVTDVIIFLMKYESQMKKFIYDSDLDKYDEFRELYWFKLLLFAPRASWAYLPVDNFDFYDIIAKDISLRFPNMTVLNNEVRVVDGVRYVGLSVPASIQLNRLEFQNFVAYRLRSLLGQDVKTPTIIISHAPLFNELSMLSEKSRSYDKTNNCLSKKVELLFEKYNIVGVIHGHHHIPASKGRFKYVDFGGRRRFVICSIYSKSNTGMNLEPIITGMSGSYI